MAMQGVLILVAAVCAYLLGSISTAILVGKIFGGDDIRSHGSGNAGATNALRVYGKKAAGIVLLGDACKAVLAVGIAYLLYHIGGMEEAFRMPMVYAATLGTVLGHNFPVYFKFHGGKGVLVSAVSVFFVDWRIGLCVLVIALAVMAIWRYVSLGSVLGAVSEAILACVLHWGEWLCVAHAWILAALLIYMHRGNIKRLLSGTESKLGQRKG